MRELMLSFADRHLSPYTLRGDELIPDFCPICHGGDNRDRYTFALNLTEGIYVCKRGSCGARGRFEELARRFGEQAEIIRPPGRMKKQYVLPEVMLKPLTDEIIGYFGKRKIGFETLDAFKIGSDEKGNIVFPFSLHFSPKMAYPAASRLPPSLNVALNVIGLRIVDGLKYVYV